MNKNAQVEISVLETINDIQTEDWDACANPPSLEFNPFLSHSFLSALENSKSVCAATGWQPMHLVVRHEQKIIGVMPMYIKGHSWGEYIFDHSWAHAYARAGREYYPKALTSIPFTPATGRRFLVRPEHENLARQGLLQGAIKLIESNDLSSYAMQFCLEDEWKWGADQGLLQRISHQYHWNNQNYKSFDDFLAVLSSRKRKDFRKERRKAQNFGGKILQLTGDDIRPEHWDAYWACYQNTGQRKGVQLYLTREFFEIIHETMRDETLLIMAERDGQFMAGAMNFIGGNTLYGRYWGCLEYHPFLHFEVCYYQAIDFAISHGLDRVEAGAQGEHKLIRGYSPNPIYSLHWIADPQFREAISNFLEEERGIVDNDIAYLDTHTPFKKSY